MRSLFFQLSIIMLTAATMDVIIKFIFSGLTRFYIIRYIISINLCLSFILIIEFFYFFKNYIMILIKILITSRQQEVALCSFSNPSRNDFRIMPASSAFKDRFLKKLNQYYTIITLLVYLSKVCNVVLIFDHTYKYTYIYS